MTPQAQIALSIHLLSVFLNNAEDYLSQQEFELLAVSPDISQRFVDTIHEFLAGNFP